MNIRTIRDLMIDAVRLDRETHEHVGPAKLRAQQLPYVHTDADMRNWGHRRGEKRSTDPFADACRLRREDDDAHSIFRLAFWEQYSREPTPQELSRADEVLGWIAALERPEERRALRAWLHSKAGGKAFRRWCLQIEGISQTTGLKRKDRALKKIFLMVGGSGAPHHVGAPLGGLPNGVDFSDPSATIAAGADEIEGLNNWAASDAKPSIEIRYESDRSGNREVAVAPSDFGWAAKQNARRRQRAAAKAKAKARQ